MVSTNDFHKVIFEYLSSSIDRKVFTKRFAELFYDIERHGDESSIVLGYVIESHLAQAICGLITEEEFRAALSKSFSGESVVITVANGYAVPVVPATPRWTTEEASTNDYSPLDVMPCR